MIVLLFKNALIKIRKSFGRYVSLLVIILVGVGFFAGIRESAPDITVALNQYTTAHQLMDFQIVSTMGLTDDDVHALKALNGVDSVTPSYSLDAMDQDKAIRIHAIEDSAEPVQLINGRMPENDEECVADSMKYSIGENIQLSGDIDEKLKNKEYTVVGTVNCPQYLSYDYGSTTVGDGKLSSYIFICRDNFTMDVYTQIQVTVLGTDHAVIFSPKYDDLVKTLGDKLTAIKGDREAARYQKIVDQANQEISDNEKTLNDEKTKNEKKLADAKAELDANALKLKNAKLNLDQKESDLQKTEITQNAQFQSARDQIADGWNQIYTALRNNGMTQDELKPKIEELNTLISSLKEQLSKLTPDSPEFAGLNAQIRQYTASYQGLVKLQNSADSLTVQQNQLDQGISTYHAQIADAEEKLTKGKNELAENEKKLDKGYSEYNANYNDFQSKTADAQEKIQDAKAKLSTIEEPQWTIMGRDTVVSGYSDLKSALHTIISVSNIIPVFFMLIVALMTANTMARMIEEERSELGTLTSLGFMDGSILLTYLLYVLSATVLGTIAGFFIGCTIIPEIIYSCFRYILPPMCLLYDMSAFGLILVVAVVLMSLVTILFCYKELKQKPAALMRPVPPRSGKTILLEKIEFLWKHLSFTWKVTMRNLFRYKQRVFMTIVGIAGCTALLLAGFGIRDSINGVAQKQYGDIFQYSDMLVLKNEVKTINGDLGELVHKEQLVYPALIRQTALKCESDGKTLNSYLIVPEDKELFFQYYHLKSTVTSNTAELDDSGVVVTQKIADLYKIKRGDTLSVKDAENHSYALTVSDIAENYIQNYMYMSNSLYTQVFGQPVSYNMIVSDDTGDEQTLAEHLIDSGLIVNVNFRNDILRQAVEGNRGLNNVILLIVSVACLLAVIVLYNLTSINISERQREVATLKVLGFTDGETNEYIYRETFLLTLLSVGIGLILGIGFHHFVMGFIEGDTILYFRKIKGLSYVYASLITIGFSAIMQVVTYFKLRKIDMIESLKSVE